MGLPGSFQDEKKPFILIGKINKFSFARLPVFTKNVMLLKHQNECCSFLTAGYVLMEISYH